MSEFRPIAEFPQYEVSRFGAVRNARTGRVIKPGRSNSGYLYVALWSKNKPHGRFIHRLVAAAFLPGFDAALQVNHKDGCKSNNAPENLEMVTGSENLLHAVHVLGFRPPVKVGGDNPIARPVEQLTLDGRMLRRFAAAMDAVREGFRAACICECCRGTQKTHGGYRWRYAEEGANA